MSQESYSQIAEDQLDALETEVDADTYNAILSHIAMIFDQTSQARQFSTALTTNQGIVMRMTVIGYPKYKIFWTSAGPSIEAVLLYP